MIDLKQRNFYICTYNNIETTYFHIPLQHTDTLASSLTVSMLYVIHSNQTVAKYCEPMDCDVTQTPSMWRWVDLITI